MHAMPRSSDYLLEGYTYHLTHRCHDRQFLLRSSEEREIYRKWLREGVRRFEVPVYAYCITRNHVHVLVHADDVEAVSGLMHLASGSTAKHYNLRTGRIGSMWQHPYHCTMVEDGRHLMNCLSYIHLNMVRTGKVAHPEQWRWCGHDELVGSRKRYRLLNVERLLSSLGIDSHAELTRWYRESIRQRLAADQLSREAVWTDSLAVGSESFVKEATKLHKRRRAFDVQEYQASESEMWMVREQSDAYTTN